MMKKNTSATFFLTSFVLLFVFSYCNEIIILDDAFKRDIGYVRMAVRIEDKVMVYYYTTKEKEEQHIKKLNESTQNSYKYR